MGALRTVLSTLAVLLAVETRVEATEFGQTHVDLGYLGLLGGYIPPIGQPFFRLDTNIVISSRFNDRDGKPIQANLGPLGQYPIKFLGNTTAEVFSFVYVPDVVLPVLNARIGTAAYTFVAGARAEAQERLFGRVSGSGETIGGLGDTTFIPFFVNVELPGAHLHVNLSPAEFTLPTGRYDRTDPIGANVGLNYASYRPAIVATYLDARGLELDLNASLSFNQTNGATHYKSGDEFGLTFAAMQHVKPSFSVGVEGYYYKQFTGDRLDGVEVNTVRPVSAFVPFDPLNQGPGNKGQVFAIGPALTHNLNATVAVDLRYQHEVFSDNRRQGEVLWGKVSACF